jgi:hypothetical protein
MELLEKLREGKVLQFYITPRQLEHYAKNFYGNGMEDLETQNVRQYDHILIQFYPTENGIIEEVWGCVPQEDGVYGERIGFFRYEELEWLEDAFTWLKKKASYNIIEKE